MTTTHSPNSWLSRALENPEARRVFEQERLALVAASALLDVMQTHGVSKAELADRLGCSRAYVSQLLDGTRNMTLRSLADLAWALGTRIGVMVDAIDSVDFRPLDVAQPSAPSMRFVDLVAEPSPREAAMASTGEFLIAA